MAPQFKLLAIDGLTRAEHSFLTEDDECYYFMEYTSYAGPHHSSANSMIQNFKKPVDRKGKPEYKFKEQAILSISKIMQDALMIGAPFATFVPMPPSRIKGDPLYDDRLMKCLIGACPRCDVRELIYCQQNIVAAHTASKRPSVAELIANFAIDKSLSSNLPNSIVLIDDLLTTGAHFKAAKTLIQQEFQGINVLGIFIARRSL